MLGLLVSEGELCVCDFVEVLEISQSKASRHLRHLVNAGLLEDRRDAIWVYFRLADQPDRAQARVIQMLPSVLTERMPAELYERLEEWSQQKEESTGKTPKRSMEDAPMKCEGNDARPAQ